MHNGFSVTVTGSAQGLMVIEIFMYNSAKSWDSLIMNPSGPFSKTIPTGELAAGTYIVEATGYLSSSGHQVCTSITFIVTQQGNNIPVTGIALDKSTASVSAWSTVKLNATVSPKNATNQNVTWSSSNDRVATVDSIGTVAGKASGTATITVTTNDGSKTAACEVTVSVADLPNLGDVAVTGVTVDRTTASVQVGSTVKLNATITPSNAAVKSVTWSSSDGSVAAVVNGTVTGVKAGTAVITATSNNGKTAMCTVTVMVAVGTGGNVNNVNLPVGNGYALVPVNGSSSPVDYNGSFSFMLTLDSNYDRSTPVVKANGTSLTPVNGVYTINNIAENISVTVSGVKENGGDNALLIVLVVLLAIAAIGVVLAFISRRSSEEKSKKD